MAALDQPVRFGVIAHRYDLLNRLMSLGRDQHWRRLAAEAVALPPEGVVLDVGTGTGDMALSLLDRWPGRTVMGIDPTPEMIALGRDKPNAPQVEWMQGDGLGLPFPAARFDAVVSAFVLRNVPDTSAALAEQVRVVRPGGRVVCLEMTWPRTAGFRSLYWFYFAVVMPRINGLLSGRPIAYRILPRSVQGFLNPDQLQAAMEAAGLVDVRYSMLALGTVALHVGARPPSKSAGRAF